MFNTISMLLQLLITLALAAVLSAGTFLFGVSFTCAQVSFSSDDSFECYQDTVDIAYLKVRLLI